MAAAAAGALASENLVVGHSAPRRRQKLRDPVRGLAN